MKKPNVIAILFTRCGCSREFPYYTYPPPPQIHMALRGKDGTPHWNNELGTAGIEERVFQLEVIGHQNEKKGELHALYKEI